LFPLFELPLVETFDCDQTVILNTDCNTGTPGEQVCVDIQPVIFRNVGNLFFSLDWDPSVLSLVGSMMDNPDLNNLSINSVPGSVDIDWSAEIGATQGTTLVQNGLPITTLCFAIDSNAPVGSSISLSSSTNAILDIDGTPFETIRIEGCAIEVMEPPLPELIFK